MLKIPSWHYNRKIEGTILFRNIRNSWVPYRMLSIVDERDGFDYTASAKNLLVSDMEIVNVNDGTWHFGIPVELGNILSSVHKKCLYPIVRPRASYKYGVNSRSVLFTDDRGNFVDFGRDEKGFINMLRGSYPDIDRATYLMRYESYESVPITKRLYMKKKRGYGNVFNLKFKTLEIGTVINENLFINDGKFIHLVEDVVDQFRSVSMKGDTDEPDLS